MDAEVTIRFTWRSIGRVTLDEQTKLKFPHAPALPGVCRFDLAAAGGRQVYIGETDRLDRRFQHYWTPGPTQGTIIRLNRLMREIRHAGGTIEISIVSDEVSVSMNGGVKPARLAVHPDRMLLEHAAIYATRESRVALVNT